MGTGTGQVGAFVRETSELEIIAETYLGLCCSVVALSAAAKVFEHGGTGQEALESFAASRFKAYSDTSFIDDKLDKFNTSISNVAADGVYFGGQDGFD